MADDKPNAWVATVAPRDGANRPDEEIIGVFTDEARAWEAARKIGPRTAYVRGFKLDEVESRG
jgi:hypothetical protein